MEASPRILAGISRSYHLRFPLELDVDLSLSAGFDT